MEKTKEQRITEVKERLEDFSKRTIRMYEFVDELVDIVKSFNEECDGLKSSDLRRSVTDELFDKAFKTMTDRIVSKFKEEKVDLMCLNILQNILYEDDRVDSKAMYLILTAWCKVSAYSYPAESLYLSLEINRILSE